MLYLQDSSYLKTASKSYHWVWKQCYVHCCSLQFDPAPRRGEPHVTRHTPDYFL